MGLTIPLVWGWGEELVFINLHTDMAGAGRYYDDIDTVDTIDTIDTIDSIGMPVDY